MTKNFQMIGLWGQKLRLMLTKGLAQIGLHDEYFLIFISIGIGAATGAFAHLFFYLLEIAHQLCFGDSEHAGLYGGRWFMLIVLPSVGALFVGIITQLFAREAKGHGVPEVMDAMYRGGSIIRPRVAAAKAIASAFTIGTGGSAGTEGPIVQIGAAIGSTVGQFLRIQRKQLSVVTACGVAAGIAAIFNAPIAGVLFALEIFLRDFSLRTFSPVVFASVISCSVMHAFRVEDVGLFEVDVLRNTGYMFAGIELPFFLLLGLLCAFAALAFIIVLYAFEDLADRARIPEFLKPVIGALGLGISGVVFLAISPSATNEVPGFYGNGYAAIKMLLSTGVVDMGIGVLLSIMALKLLATCLTLGSGGSGGVFAPSLLIGAALGAAFGKTLHAIGWVDVSSITAYALVGMGAVVAATTHAPLTAIVMLYEITREPKVILPVMFAAMIATVVAQLIKQDSIYTLKLRRRGVQIGSTADLTVLRRVCAADVDFQAVSFIHPEDPVQRLIDLAGETDTTDFVVVDEHADYQGMVTGADVRTALLQPEAVALLVVGELMRASVPMVRPSDTLDTVLGKFARFDIESLPVAGADGQHIEGLITRRAVISRYHQELSQPLG